MKSEMDDVGQGRERILHPTCNKPDAIKTTAKEGAAWTFQA